MKFFLRLVLIIVLGYAVSLWFPWWSVAIVGAFIGILFSEKRRKRMFGKQPVPARAFLAGFLALFILWGGMALWTDWQNDSLLSEKISKIIVPEGEIFLSRAWLMILVTALIGGLTGGFSTMTGNLLGEAVRGMAKD
ncbi:MAG: hypothetical protein SF052_03740 [Bacteroidia bacterium]|nr:hypothetical protein [Bacteroidia bacterium]